MTEKKKIVLVNIGKLIAVTLTLSLSFSFGWQTHKNYYEEGMTDTLLVSPEEALVVWVDTVMVPKTVTFYDTIGVHKVHYDTVLITPPTDPGPPRPWGTKGRP